MSNAKSEAVLQAAAMLFSRQGVRKTSMDQIAREAHVAKPTLYAHFGDKEALYAAVCAAVGAQIVAAARAAAARESPLPERVTQVLASKFTRVFELIDSSPHAQELLGAHNKAARQEIDQADAAFRAVLTDVLESASASGALDLKALGLTTAALAAQLMQVGHGAAYGATTSAQHGENLAALVSSVLRAGLEPKPATASGARQARAKKQRARS